MNCPICGESMEGKRRDAKTCGGACRIELHRRTSVTKIRNTSGLQIRPISFRDACAFISKHHRHHKPPQGMKFAVSVYKDDQLAGVAIVGRPVARKLDNGLVAEVVRCCTDGTRNAPTKLYAAAWQAARAMGYTKLITYTLEDEPGTSLKAGGWKREYVTRGKSWNVPTRARVDKHPLGNKVLWSIEKV